MQAQHPSSSECKAITASAGDRGCFKPTRPMLANALIGAALIGYLVHKTPDARVRLECLTNMARTMGDLTERDAELIAQQMHLTDLKLQETIRC
ncbi:hypothetical protein [Pseudomonas sp. NFIX28]|uniref:hypothetical protein n=1 Tax=Pseudomonas sp. NFIX28 TaxID=1566235 RepID=UPI000B80EA33|nr:hypothetical protein [Pseudomonas sp. NFIX28]